MSGQHGGDNVGIEMVEREMKEDLDDHGNSPGGESTTEESPYKTRFGNILKDYDDERTWWTAAKDLLDVDFAADVSCSSACMSACGENDPV